MLVEPLRSLFSKISIIPQSYSHTYQNSLEVLPVLAQIIASRPPPLLQYHKWSQNLIVNHSNDPQASSPTQTPPLPMPPAPELPITIRKGIHSSRNPNPFYAFTINYDYLSPSYFSFVSSLDFVFIPKDYKRSDGYSQMVLGNGREDD